MPILHAGFKAVKRNGGSPGTDGVTIQTLETLQDYTNSAVW